MNAIPATPELIESCAAVIEAAGFLAMAQEFRARPEMRTRIAAAMIRNITRDDRERGERFARSLRDVTFEAAR
jgi:hypothetical protein